MIRVNRAAIRELLKDDAVLADLTSRGEAIRNAAGEGVEMRTGRGRNRVRVSVFTATPEAMLNEARDRSLTNAVDAGR